MLLYSIYLHAPDRASRYMQMHADELTGQSQNSNSASAGKEEELASAGHDHLLGGGY